MVLLVNFFKALILPCCFYFLQPAYFCIKYCVFGLCQHKNMLLFPSQKYQILIPVTFPGTTSFFYSPLQQNSLEELPTNCLQFFPPVVSKTYSYSKLVPQAIKTALVKVNNNL